MDKFGDAGLISADECYEASWAQWHLAPPHGADRPVEWILDGPLDPARLRRALDHLVDRHEALRTTLDRRSGQLVQCLHAAGRCPLTVHPAAPNSSNRWPTHAHLEPFPQGRRRLALHRLYGAADARTDALLGEELFRLYAGESLPPATWQFADYSLWNNDHLASESGTAARRYWTNLHAIPSRPWSLPGVLPMGLSEPSGTGEVSSRLSVDQVSSLRRALSDLGVTLEEFFLAAWWVVLCRFTDQQDGCVGVTFSGREPEVWARVVGPLEHRLPLRQVLAPAEPLGSFIRGVAEGHRLARRFQGVPRELLGPAGADAVLSVGYRYHATADVFPGGEWDGLRVWPVRLERLPDLAVLELAVREAGDMVELTLSFDRSALPEAIAQRWPAYLEQVVHAVIVSPELPLDDIDLVPADEKTFQLFGLNPEPVDFGAAGDLATRFIEQARLTPDAPAVIHRGEATSYADLQRQATRFSERILDLGGSPSGTVAVLLPRGAGCLAAILGVLEAGCAFLPIDSRSPPGRVRRLLEDGESPILIADPQLLRSRLDLDQRPPHLRHVLAPDALAPHAGQRNRERVPELTSPAYLIYTSGSTGQPRGTLIRHDGALNHIEAEYRLLALPATARILQSAPLSSDIAIWQYLGPVTRGGCAVVADDEDLLDSAALLELLRAQAVTLMELVPAVLANLLDHVARLDVRPELPDLRWLMATGESVPVGLVNNWLGPYPHVRVVNAYGPAEASDDVIQYVAETPLPAHYRSVPVGKPLPNFTVSILDDRGRLCPLGAAGEIGISGVGVGAGYWKDPEKTRRHFVPNTLEGTCGSVIYRTGDRGRWMPDGNVEFLGRRDEQVKIRGHRVEPGEVEHELRAFSGVDAAAVVADGDRQSLVAYVVARVAIEADALRAWLAGRLPEPMVPAQVIFLDQLPLTANGKIDRRALPRLTGRGAPADGEGGPPRSVLEQRLLALWTMVLPGSPPDVHANFFAVGGHSLAAIRLLSLVQRELEIKLALTDLMAAPTVAGLAERVRQAESARWLPIEPEPDRPAYELSHAQRGVWIQCQRGAAAAFHMTDARLIEGPLDLAAFRCAFDELVRRHESLRTVFVTRLGVPGQEIRPPHGFALEVLDLGDRRDAEDIARRCAEEEVAAPFDLERGPLARGRLLRLVRDRNVFLFTMHHLIGDQWSMTVLLRDLLLLYKAFTAGKPASLPPLPIQYRDYAAWYDRRFQDEAERHRAYWRDRLAGPLGPLELPVNFPRPERPGFRGDVVRLTVSADCVRSLHDQRAIAGATLFQTVLAAAHVWAHAVTGQTDVILGYPVAARDHPALEDQIGLYANLLPSRVAVDPAATFSTLLGTVKQSCLEAAEHQVYPFDLLWRHCAASASPVNVVFNWDESGTARILDAFPGLKLRELPQPAAGAKNDLDFFVSLVGEQLGVTLLYSTDLFRAETIEHLGGLFVRILEEVAEDPGRPVAELVRGASIGRRGPESGQGPALSVIYGPRAAYPAATVVDLVEAQAARCPDAPAVITREACLTFRELNEQANRLAHHLRTAFEIGPEGRVGLLLDRSHWMIVAVLGVLKAGAAFVPFDTEYPRQRLERLLAESDARILILHSDFLTEQDFPAERSFVIDIQLDTLEESASDLPERPQPESLAYVLFTSGSTGRALGVCVEHHSLAHYIQWANQAYFQGQNLGSFPLFTSLCFDLTLTSVFCPLTRGRALHVFGHGLPVADVLKQIFQPNSPVDCVKLTPAHLRVLVEVGLDRTDVRTVIVGGEALAAHHVEVLRRLCPDIAVFNEYGPTEATVGCAVEEVADATGAVPIGRPIANTTIALLDDSGRPVPTGNAGEIAISGPCVARGYLRAEPPAADRFQTDPDDPASRWYRTGDLGRVRADGRLDYLGRIDQQLKVRGYRVEPGEVECVLLEDPRVSQAVVLGRPTPTGELELVACCVAAPEVSESTLRDRLQETLPAYMVPARFVRLDHIPLTPNGKTDRAELLRRAAEPIEIESAGSRLPLRSERERLLAGVWEDVLQRRPIGPDDNFFRLGGDSITAIQVASRLHQLQLKLELGDLFRFRTVSELAPQLTEVRSPTEQRPLTGEVPLLPIQRQFFAEHPAGRDGFSIYLSLRAPTGFNVDALRAVLTQIQEHHDALRARFRLEGDRVVQEIADTSLPLALQVLDLRDRPQDLDEHTREVARSINLQRGPVFAAALYRLPDGDRLVLVMHHLVVDGVSLRVLLEDMALGYHQFVNGGPVRLPARTDSVKAWAEALIGYSRQATTVAERAYWRALENTPARTLRGDFESSERSWRGYLRQSLTIPAAETEALTARGDSGGRVDEFLLAALARVVQRWQDWDEVPVTLEGHGREPIASGLDVSRTLGWLASSFPVILRPGPHASPEERVRAVRDTLNSIPARGIGYGVLCYLTPEEDRDGLHLEFRPEIAFNYLGSMSTRLGPLEAEWVESGSWIEPETPMPHALAVDAVLIRGTLNVILWYNSARFRPDTIAALLERYAEELRELLAAPAPAPEPVPVPASHQSDAEAEELARWCVRGGEADPHVLPFRAGRGANVFFVPPRTGQGLVFRELISELHADLGALLLTCPGVLSAAPPPDSVAETAVVFHRAVRRWQDRGPYLLVGYSFGGLVAFELARGLEQDGDRVTLILIDQPPREPRAPSALEYLQTLTDDVRHYRDTIAFWGSALGPDATERLTELYMVNAFASHHYEPGGRISGDIVAIAGSSEAVAEGMRRWAEYTTGRFDLRRVRGSHSSVLHRPDVTELAWEVDAALRTGR